MDMLSPFIDLEGLAEEAAEKTTQDKVAATPVDTTYPLASVEMNALIQIHRDCRSKQSKGLLTWCTGHDVNSFFDGYHHEEGPCPRGILTHPCTGRVLHSINNASEGEFLWPWKGIRCDPYTDPTTVTHIYLPGEGLQCELAKIDLSVMVSLEQVDLSTNRLYGGVPAWLGDMTVLRLLNLADNTLTGDIPSSFAGNDALELINFSGNSLSASTFRFFDAFRRLQYLDLSSNNFTIKLSNSVFASKYLRTVNLSHNEFHGEVSQLPIFHFLESFDVSSNLFTGSIPPQLSLWGREDPHDPYENSSLTTINVSNNFFTGSLPVLSNQSALQRFDVHNNLLDGFLPDFPLALLDHLEPSMVDGNAFRCPIPVALLPSNLSCVCGDGYTIKSDIVAQPLWHEKNTARVAGNQAIELCIPCRQGLYSNATTKQKCSSCPAGTVPSEEANHCKACLPGTFSNESGARSCSPCPQGTFTADIGATLCTSCHPGQFAIDQGSMKCALCPVGTFSKTKGATMCASCPAGTYARVEGEAECLMCPKDTYQDVVGSAECKSCPLGYIAPQQGHVKCSPCSPGSFFDVISRTCTLCRAGTYTKEAAQIECRKCKNGTVAEGFGNVECLDVAVPGAGYTATSKALRCDPGTFNDGSWRTCQLCPLGTFAAERGSKMCSMCAKGSFASSMGSSHCQIAPLGSFVRSEGAVQAEPCPPNLHTAANGSIMCTQCQPPSFSFLPGSDKCAIAKAGEVYDHVEWPRLALELVGIEQHDLFTKRNHELLIDVLIHTWTDTLTNFSGFKRSLHVLQVLQPLGSTQSTQIIVAVETTTLLSSKTRPLDEGISTTIHQATEAAKSALDDLLYELSGSESGKQRHKNDKNQVADLVKSNSFQDALVRHFGHMNLSFAMMNMSIVEPPLVSTRAVACAPGTFLTVIGTSERVCQYCPVGSFSSTEGALECKLCPRGTFSADEGVKVCKPCPLGEDAARGASSCVKCSWFTYECKGFWQDLILAIGISAGLLRVLFQKIHRLCSGDQTQQQQTENVALMAAVRAHGRTFDRVHYAPMGIVSADTLFGIVPPGAENTL